jgi:glutamine synthetase adenylyltransferase
MRDTCDRVARITKELKALSTQFQRSAFEDSSPDEQAQILDELVNGSLVEDLRSTVDYLSQFLWSYIESAAEGSSQENHVDRALKNLRLARITEMLRILHRSSRPTQDPLAFVDRVTESVDRYLQAADDLLLCEQDVGDIATSGTARGQLAKGNGRIISGSSLLDS